MSNSSLTDRASFKDASGQPIPGTPAPMPCPFCGSGRPGRESMLAIFEDQGVFTARCQACTSAGPEGMTAIEAAQRWNARFDFFAVPPNLLVGDLSADTMNNVASVLAWMGGNKPDRELVPADHVASKLDFGSHLMQLMVQEAIEYERRRLTP
jgi:hypothetical protein